jgi:hypothetical protein
VTAFDPAEIADVEGEIGKTNRRGRIRLSLYRAVLKAAFEQLKLSDQIGRSALAEARRL